MTPRDVIKWAGNNDDNDDVVLIMMNCIWSPNYVQNTFWWFLEQIFMALATPPPLPPSLREGIQKNHFFLGNSPKQQTPPTHPYGLGLT